MYKILTVDRFNDLSRWVLIVFLIGISVSCAEKSVQEQEMNDLSKAIDAIEDRKNAEIYIIKEETKILKVLESNYEKANSEGMREKISREISMKESVINKAELNKENQESILRQLNAKKDSLKNVIENSEI